MGNLARRYGVDQAPPDPKLKLVSVAPEHSTRRPTDKVVAGLREAISVAKGKATPARETKLGGETKINKRGRPRKRASDPWIAEGVSKATWFRRAAKVARG